MIGSEDMSTSTGMDISEPFRTEDLSKTDFFDFVTAPEMGIGIGVGVGVDVGISLQHHHHQQQQQQQHQQQQTHQHTSHHHAQQHQTQQSGSDRINTESMTHDGGGDSIGGCTVNRNGNNNNNNNSRNSDPTLQGYEFWHTDKDHSRLDSSSIFEDFDRYCWQQQPATATSAPTATTTSSIQPAHTSPTSPLNQPQSQQHRSSTSSASSTSATATASRAGGQVNSANATNNIDSNDGQIYTLTVLNGGEPWLKRTDVATVPDHQLPGTLDLDSLLGSFSGYIKSEFPCYDDSGFDTESATKELVNSVDINGISISHGNHHSVGGSGQTLPSVVTAISIAGGGNGLAGDASTLNLGQQLEQLQNNNNDWQMADHNAGGNSAESLLRSALQGKGYAKNLQMQNGITLMPASPTIKEEDILFTPVPDSLGFTDSTPIFDDTQTMNHANQMLVQHTPSTSGTNHSNNNNNTANNTNANMTSIIVDDMFLSLENAFSDEFEKIKREVHQFCATGTATTSDYTSSDVLMEIAPSAATTTNATTTQLQQQQQQQLHSPATTPTGQTAGLRIQQPPPQPIKPEVSTSTMSAIVSGSGTSRLVGVTKPKKQYKRNSSISNNHNHNNNNNPNVINHNNSSSGNTGTMSSMGMGVSVGVGVAVSITPNGSSSSSSGSSASSSNSPPSNCNGGASAANSSGSSASGSSSGQRKERSLHYCSICSKGFKDKYSVNVHIRTHTGEKPFACSLCGKSFRQKAHLAKHYQTHMTQKNNGNLVKGSSSKHPRSNTGSSATGVTVAQQRQLSAGVANTLANPSINVSGANSALMSATGTTVLLNGPALPPANGLLTNR